MKKQFPSTMTTALQMLEQDPEIRSLIHRIGGRYPDQGPQLVQDLIIRALDTSALTVELGARRPGGLEFFRAELRMLADGDG